MKTWCEDGIKEEYTHKGWDTGSSKEKRALFIQTMQQTEEEMEVGNSLLALNSVVSLVGFMSFLGLP